MSPDDVTERRRVIYSGRVQGVGFRMMAASIARRYALAGYVRNLPDGTVELVADGAAGTLDQFLGDVAGAFGRNIEECRPLEANAGEELSRFEIRH